MRHTIHKENIIRCTTDNKRKYIENLNEKRKNENTTLITPIHTRDTHTHLPTVNNAATTPSEPNARTHLHCQQCCCRWVYYWLLLLSYGVVISPSVAIRRQRIIIVCSNIFFGNYCSATGDSLSIIAKDTPCNDIFNV